MTAGDPASSSTYLIPSKPTLFRGRIENGTLLAIAGNDSLPTGLTVEAWVQIEAQDPSPPQVILSQTSGACVNFALSLSVGHGSPEFSVTTDAGTFIVDPSNSLKPGWHHLAGTYDGEQLRLYLDGQIASERPANGVLAFEQTPMIAGRTASGEAPFNGCIHSARCLKLPLKEIEIYAIAETFRHHAITGTKVYATVKNAMILDGRSRFQGMLHLQTDDDGLEQIKKSGLWRMELALHDRNTQEIVWRERIKAGITDHLSAIPFELPIQRGGYFELKVKDFPYTCEFVVRKDQCEELLEKPDYLRFVQETVEKILETTVARSQGSGVLHVTTSRQNQRAYRSLGHRLPTGGYYSVWVPELPIEFDCQRADLAIWPVLDQLSQQTGDQRYAKQVAAMADDLASRAFDPRSGLLYINESFDLNVTTGQPISRGSHIVESFKPLNSGSCPGLPLDRLWKHAPTQLHRTFKSVYYGLITDPVQMSYNRVCSMAFDDAKKKHSRTPNPRDCAFDTAGARLIHWWASCYAHTGDTECLEWAQQMADKWEAVQHPQTGLIPNFFGGSAWKPGAEQKSGLWVESRCAAQAALAWIEAVSELQKKEQGRPLAGQLKRMASGVARGLMEFGYDQQRRLFREHIHLDGRPYDETARYCFHTAEQRRESMIADPSLAEVPVYDGTGLFHSPIYLNYCAGTAIPSALAHIAYATKDQNLVKPLDLLMDDIAAEARLLDGAFTDESRWTYVASALYIKANVFMARITEDAKYLRQASALADREIAALSRVQFPHWWRMRERTYLLDAILMLHTELKNQ